MTPPSAVHVRVERPLTSGGDHLPWGGVDIDVHHDTDGLPRLRRSTLHARLSEAALDALPARPDLLPAAVRLFGRAGSHDDTRILSLRDALLPAAVRRRFTSPELGIIPPSDTLDAFTTVVTTTAIDATGAPARGTRRDARAVLPGVLFVAALHWLAAPTDSDLRCLAWAVLGLRQLGLGGSRGRGLVTASLDGDRAATLAAAGLSGEEL